MEDLREARLRLAQDLFGPLARGDVLLGGHAIQQVPIVVPHADQVHLGGIGAAILAEHVCLVLRAACAVSLGNVLLDVFPILRRVQLQDGHGGDFLDGAVQQARKGGVTGQDAVGGGQPDGDAVRAVLEGIRPLALDLLILHRIERKGDIQPYLFEQGHLLLSLKVTDLVRNKTQHTDGLALQAEWNAGQGMEVVGPQPFMHGPSPLVGLNIFTGGDLPGSYGNCDDPVLIRPFPYVGDGERPVRRVQAADRHGADLAAGFVEQADPGQGILAKARADVANGLEQILAAANAHNGLVDLAQGGVQALHLQDLFFGKHAFGHIDGQDEDPLGHGLDAEIEPARLSIGVNEIDLQMRGRAFFHAAFELGKYARGLDAWPHLHVHVAKQLRIGAAVVFFSGAIHVQVAPVEAQDLATFEHVVEGGAEAFLAATEVLLRLPAGGDVAAGGVDFEMPVVGINHKAAAHLHPDGRAILAQLGQFIDIHLVHPCLKLRNADGQTIGNMFPTPGQERLLRGLAQGLLGRQAAQLLDGGADVGKARGIQVERPDHVRDILGQQQVFSIGGAQGTVVGEDQQVEQGARHQDVAPALVHIDAGQVLLIAPRKERRKGIRKQNP